MVVHSPRRIGVGHDSTHLLSTAANLRDGNVLNVAFSSGFEPLPPDEALERYGRVPPRVLRASIQELEGYRAG